VIKAIDEAKDAGPPQGFMVLTLLGHALALRQAHPADKFIRPKPVRPILDDVTSSKALCFNLGCILVRINVDKMPWVAVTKHAPSEHPAGMAWVRREILGQAAYCHVHPSGTGDYPQLNRY